MFITAATLFWPTIPFVRAGGDHALARSGLRRRYEKPPSRRRPLRLAAIGDRFSEVLHSVAEKKSLAVRTIPARLAEKKLKRKEEFVAIGDNGNSVPAEVSGKTHILPGLGPTGWRLLAQWFFRGLLCPPRRLDSRSQIFAARQITAILAIWGLSRPSVEPSAHTKICPKEAKLLLIMIGLLYFGAFLSLCGGRRLDSHHSTFPRSTSHGCWSFAGYHL